MFALASLLRPHAEAGQKILKQQLPDRTGM